MVFSSLAKRLIRKMPAYQLAYSYLQAHFERNPSNPFLRSAPPGHFYSPIPDIDYVRQNRDDLFDSSTSSVPGIDINAEQQIQLIRQLEPYYSQIPFTDEKREGFRYYFDNHWFARGSAIILYSIMRHFHPKRIVEIGSGYSSAAMLDVNDRFFDGKIAFCFVDPYPDRLLSLMNENDTQTHQIVVDNVQNCPNQLFTDLDKDDIVFIDSSHVAKVGSDVVYLLTNVLPTLKPGVIIHIHDIYWPFEYPEDWILSGRAWNEAYFVKAFLQFNSHFEILLFNAYLAMHHRELMQRHLPLFLPNAGSSLWIRKTL
jgi:predicted O-methyltransferase YrrM